MMIFSEKKTRKKVCTELVNLFEKLDTQKIDLDYSAYLIFMVIGTGFYKSNKKLFNNFIKEIKDNN